MAQTGYGLAGTPLEFRRESWRGQPGFFRVARTTGGAWWVIAPDQTPVIWRGVNEVGRGRSSETYAQMVGARFGSEDHASFADDGWRRLTGWGFRGLGPGSAVELTEEGRARVVVVGFSDTPGPMIRLGGARLPDVFDGGWAGRCEARAVEVGSRHRGDRDVLGYLADADLNWAEFPAAREESRRIPRASLLQICLSLEPAFAAYHAAWEFALAPHGGDLNTMARAWGLELPGRPMVRQWTQEDRVIDTEGYRRDDARFAREFARRYFGTTAAALRTHDGQHLILGGRFGVAPSAAILGEAAAMSDVLWLPAGQPWGAAELDGVSAGGAVPVMLDGFAWNRPEFFAGEAGENLSDLERMLRGGRARLETALVHPACCGYTWAAWRAGNAWAVPPWPEGLIFDDDRPVWAHVEPLRAINRVAEARRAVLG